MDYNVGVAYYFAVDEVWVILDLRAYLATPYGHLLSKANRFVKLSHANWDSSKFDLRKIGGGGGGDQAGNYIAPL